MLINELNLPAGVCVCVHWQNARLCQSCATFLLLYLKDISHVGFKQTKQLWSPLSCCKQALKIVAKRTEQYYHWNIYFLHKLLSFENMVTFAMYDWHLKRYMVMQLRLWDLQFIGSLSTWTESQGPLLDGSAVILNKTTPFGQSAFSYKATKDWDWRPALIRAFSRETNSTGC